MNFAKDNYYKECPAVMDYSQLTDYRQSSVRENNIRNINKIVSDHEYRYFLQTNAAKIMDNEWGLLSTSYNCQPNVCIHNSSTAQPEGEQYTEMKLYNDTRAGKADPSAVQCKKMPDYRMC
jgi:ubiquitin C-terminal hydrolase